MVSLVKQNTTAGVPENPTAEAMMVHSSLRLPPTLDALPPTSPTAGNGTGQPLARTDLQNATLPAFHRGEQRASTFTIANTKGREWLWWAGLGLIWLVATAADRLWLDLDRRLPSWDQADYLNSALDHGRALGLLPGGGWQGWGHLLDLSPKIPPLASLVNGTVMAIAGDTPQRASWALALWHGLLLVALACWARTLGGRRFALLAAALLSLVPALAVLRVDYTLDLALAACTTLALALLGRWQTASPLGGGRWGQALAAALAIAAAVLVKQSALLVLTLPSLWAALRALPSPRRRLQVLVALLIVIGLALPWLHHNWITTLGGTNRAVIESAASEGDPDVLSLGSLLWYPRLWPSQLGIVLLTPALGAALMAAWLHRQRLIGWLRHPVRALPPGWAWLIGCTLAGWLCTTLSPNKDGRYIAPVLPLLTLLVARGWWQIGLWLQARPGLSGGAIGAGALALGLLAGAGELASAQARALRREAPSPAPAAMAELRRRVGETPITLLVVPGSPDLNEQTLTTYGRLGGGRIEARRLGRNRREHPVVLERSDWLLLATGDQGTTHPGSRELSERIRRDGRFERLAHWPWNAGRQVELWRRRDGAPFRHESFDASFIRLARGMERGPAGIRELFDRIGAEHQADGHFLYQQRVAAWARERLRQNPSDRDALWSLALIETLRNRPQAALPWYGRLQELDPSSPWPAAYRAVVLLADWRPGSAAHALRETPSSAASHPVNRALSDLSRGLSGHPLSLERLRVSLPEAIAAVKLELIARPQP
jgi:4-amino-4-deoxy-L-arabinose transferase-like glycosyltransferase